MKSISFDGMGGLVATFEAAQGVRGGQVVKLTGSAAVGPCAAGDSFAGVALEPRDGLVAVQLKGFCRLPATGLSVGRARLEADGQGGVRPVAAAVVQPGEDGGVTLPAAAGVDALVVSVDLDGGAVICL